jgi:hypothetical protein
MSEEPEAPEPIVVKRNVITLNGWSVTVFLLVAMIGFVIFGTPSQHEAFLGGIERIIGAFKDLLTG